jgi:GNAT superfamily N-acetyltransferase
MKRGDLVALAFAGEEVAAFGWTTFKDALVREVGATRPLHPDEAVQFNSLVMPHWRGSGLADAITGPVLRYPAEHGCRRILSWIHALNTRLIKTVLRQGKHQVATILVVHSWAHPPAQLFTRNRRQTREKNPRWRQAGTKQPWALSFRRPPSNWEPRT